MAARLRGVSKSTIDLNGKVFITGGSRGIGRIAPSGTVTKSSIGITAGPLRVRATKRGRS